MEHVHKWTTSEEKDSMMYLPVGAFQSHLPHSYKIDLGASTPTTKEDILSLTGQWQWQSKGKDKGKSQSKALQYQGHAWVTTTVKPCINGRGNRDGEYMYIQGWFMSMYDKNHYNIKNNNNKVK